MPKLTFEVVSQRANDYEGKSGPVHQEICGLADKSPGSYRLGHMVEWLIPEKHMDLSGQLADRKVVLGVQRVVEWQGAIRVEGELLELDGKPVNGTTEAAATAPVKK